MDKCIKLQYNRLLGLMKERGYTQKKLSQVLGKSENAITNKIKGRSTFDSLEIVSICNLLGISVDDIGFYFFTPLV